MVQVQCSSTRGYHPYVQVQARTYCTWYSTVVLVERCSTGRVLSSYEDHSNGQKLAPAVQTKRFWSENCFETTKVRVVLTDDSLELFVGKLMIHYVLLTGPLFPIGIEHLIYMKFFCYGSSYGY